LRRQTQASRHLSDAAFDAPVNEYIRSCAELFGGHIILILVSWRMAGLLLPPGWGPLSPMQLAAAVSTALQLPLLFVDLRRLSRLAMVGLASSGFLISMVLSLLVLDPHRQAMPQQPPPSHHLASVGVIQAIGVFALSSTAHSTLPALRIAMQKPSRFPLALLLGFSTMLLGYSAIAAAGYWYWGDAASPLAADDLAANSFFTGGRLPIHKVLAAFVLVNCLTKVPGLILVLQDMLISFLPHGEATYFHPPKLAYLIRTVLFGCGTLLALTAYQVLGSALSLLGGLASISCSLLLPTAFYSLLSWRRLGAPAKVGLVALLAVGVALVGLITASNLCDLMERCRERHSHSHSGSNGSGSGSWLPWGGLLAALLPPEG
jgi:vesicular inhibitory amino acid transporter